MWEYGSRLVLKDRLQPSFTLRLVAKDLGLATDLAGGLGVALSLGAHVAKVVAGLRRIRPGRRVRHRAAP